jgi:integrase
MAGLPYSVDFEIIAYVPPTTAAVASSPKLLDRVRWRLRVKHYAIRTEQAYVDWIRRYTLFHRKRHPNEMGERVKRPAKLPVVLTPTEARAVLAHLKGDYRLMAELLYGSGLRLMECLRLRIKDIDFGYNRITVRDAKGLRDRVTLLPQRLQRALRGQIARVEELHREELARGGGKVYLPFALRRKIPQCCARIDLAISLSGDETFARSPLRRTPTTPCLGEKSPKRCETCRPGRRP